MGSDEVTDYSEFVWVSTWLLGGDRPHSHRHCIGLKQSEGMQGVGAKLHARERQGPPEEIKGAVGTQGDPAMVSGSGEAGGHMGRAEEAGGMEVNSPEPVLIRTSSHRDQLRGSAGVLRWRAGW